MSSFPADLPAAEPVVEPPVVEPPVVEIVQTLQQRVRQIESGRLAPMVATAESTLEKPTAERSVAVVSSCCGALDRLLPAGGFRRGTLVEWLANSSGSGAGTLALLVARQAALEGGAVVVVDRNGWFYPLAAAALGMDLERIIVVRSGSARDEIWALDQSLRCPGVAAVWSSLGDQIDQRDFRRLQLAAETGNSLGLLLRPATVRGKPTWSDVQLLVEPRPATSDHARCLHIQLTRCRGRLQPRTELDLELGDNGEITAEPVQSAQRGKSAEQNSGSFDREQLG